MITIQNFINNQWSSAHSQKTLITKNPATDETIGSFPDSDVEDIHDAILAAEKSFPSWAQKNPDERAKYLHRIADLIEKNIEEFAHAESQDQGKPEWLARDMDMNRVVKNFRFFADAMLHQSSESFLTNHEALNYVIRKPLGVVGLISPWNLPLYLLTWKIAPALAMGNTVVCKPSELTPITAFLFSKILHEAELPPGVCNIVFGLGEKAGDALVGHEKVKAISFTGGTETAQHITKRAAQFPTKKLSLELGGKNPMIVFKDADLKASVTMAVRSSFLNQGEICLCSSRIYIEQEIYSQFLEQFIFETKKTKIGDPQNKETFMGPLISKEHREKVMSFLDEGKIVAGGKIPKLDNKFSQGNFFEPTIVTDVADHARIIQEEVFGPIVTVQSFSTEEEIIQRANQVRYGLSASIWTNDLTQAHRVAKNLQVGQVWINSWMLRDLRVPFGGSKSSGLGREGGQWSLNFFSEPQNICVKLL